MAVARECQTRDGLVRGFERRTQPVAQRALACAVNTLDDDEHAASLSGREQNGRRATLVSERVSRACEDRYRIVDNSRIGSVVGELQVAEAALQAVAQEV